jgi:modulator of FtsH protease HflC
MMNRIVSGVIASTIALMIFSSTIFVVDQRRYAIVFALGEIREVIAEPGLHFKLPPPFQNVVYLDRRILTIDTPDTERYITAEKRNLLVDTFVKWRIADPKKYYVSFGDNETRAQDRMGQILRAALNEEITKRTSREVVASDREKMMEAVRVKTVDDTAAVGVEILDVRIKRVDLSPEVVESVYRSMEAERKRVANELRSTGAATSEQIRADADRQREVLLANAYRDAQRIRGEGDAKASNIYAAAFGQNPEFAAFYRSLEAYRASFATRSDLMVVDPTSEFFKYMKNPGGGKR